jgi:beta-lactamase regulating signal transducer with metallopeptidase domain
MTIEFSLRRRAARSRYMATLWLALATAILIGTYISLPIIANDTLNAAKSLEAQPSGAKNTLQPPVENNAIRIEVYAVSVLALGLLAICFACFLLGRSAFVEIELAARFNGFADALCIAGENFEQLEKAANLLVPKTKFLSVPRIFSPKDVKPILEVLKELRSK